MTQTLLQGRFESAASKEMASAHHAGVGPYRRHTQPFLSFIPSFTKGGGVFIEHLFAIVLCVGNKYNFFGVFSLVR